MKKFSTLLVASFALITVTAQKNFDTALENAPTVSTYTSGSLSQPDQSVTIVHYRSQNMPAKGITVLPAAGSTNIKIVFNAAKSGDATIAVIDQDGKKVLNQPAHLSTGNNNIIIDNFTSLNEGNYTIQLISTDTTYTSSFILWK